MNSVARLAKAGPGHDVDGLTDWKLHCARNCPVYMVEGAMFLKMNHPSSELRRPEKNMNRHPHCAKASAIAVMRWAPSFFAPVCGAIEHRAATVPGQPPVRMPARAEKQGFNITLERYPAPGLSAACQGAARCWRVGLRAGSARSWRFAPLFEPVRPDLRITIVPGIGHIGMTVAPAGISAARKSFLDLTAPPTG